MSLALVLLFLANPALATDEGVVKGSIVNIRGGPGTSYNAITQVQAGQALYIIGNQNNWLKIRLHNGTEGWIRSDLVERFLKKVTVTGSTVNTRTGPGTNYNKAGQVFAGQVLPILAEKNGWYKVQISGQGEVWVAGWLTTITNTSDTNNTNNTGNTSNTGSNNSGNFNTGSHTDSVSLAYVMINTKVLNVRKGPGTGYALVTKIGLNETHEVLTQKDGWYKIKVKNMEGWVSSNYVKYIPAATVPQDQNPAPQNIPDNTPDNTVPTVQPVKKDVLIIPVAEGKTFKVADHGGKPELSLEGWTKEQYKIKLENGETTLILELQGPSTRRYEGQIDRLGISKIKIFPSGEKAIVELTFNFVPLPILKLSDNGLITTIQVGVGQTKGLTGKTIVLDPGHGTIQPGGWPDPGALGVKTKLQEKDVNLANTLKLKALLEKAGAKVVLIHTGQTTLTVAERAAVANNISADIYVSIHANAKGKYEATGHTTYYYAPASDALLTAQRDERQRLAALVQREMVKNCGRKDNGILEANYGVLRETKMPSILVEAAYLSDKEEEALLGQDWFRQKLAEGIFNGIKEYFK